jgi:hypothetical protein
MKTQLIIFFTIMAFTLSAQTYVDIPWREGSVMSNGEKQDGMIRLGGDLNAPWLNNTKVYFVTAEDYGDGSKRIKKKLIKEYKPEDLDGYQTYTMSKMGEKVDMTFKSYEIMIMGAFKKKKGKAFLKVEEEGDVNVYSYVPMPSKKLVTTANERYEDGQNAISRSTLYLESEDTELTKAADCDLVTLLQDCEKVVENINNEVYGFKPKSKRKKKKGFGKLMAAAGSDNNFEMQVYTAVLDYNQCMEEK